MVFFGRRRFVELQLPFWKALHARGLVRIAQQFGGQIKPASRVLDDHGGQRRRGAIGIGYRGIVADRAVKDLVRPAVEEATALGAGFAAGLAEGVWDDPADVRDRWREGGRWSPSMDPSDRAHLTNRWVEAVQRTLDWA